MACHHVFALHDAKEKWQGAPLLESGRKPPSRWWPGGPAAGALSWRDQRQSARGLAQVIQVRLKDLEVRNARQWGGCWLVCELYEQLKLDQFWAERLPPGRKGTRWDLILQTLCIYRFIEPGSEWRLHRYWFDRSAVPELLGSDFRLAESHRLYECHDLLLKHKGALFTHLTERW